MKILAYIFLKNSDGAPSASTDNFYYWPDSCWLLSNRPLFIPDFDSAFTAIPAMAVRSDRVGKAIPMRYTPRYFGSWAPALIILPQAEVENFFRGKPIASSRLCFDNAIVLGEWQNLGLDIEPLPPAEKIPALASSLFPESLHLEISSSDRAKEAHIDNRNIIFHTDLFPEAFSRLSYNNVLKTGDVILIPSEEYFPVTQNTIIRISDSTCNSNLLITKFK